jgi:unsaturated rhamnogalacturonyl hydrolase
MAGMFLAMSLSATSDAQSPAGTERVVRLVADRLLKDAPFQFVDVRSGRRYMAADQAPSGTDLQLASPYNDWRYWNGVLGMAMARLGDELGDSGYAQFPRKNIAFAFDNSPYFERRRTNEDKWGYPFAQHFIMEELDDCGAMGASTIEVFQNVPQDRYRLYISRAGEHLRTRQSRLPDGTFVRSFPRKWTLWADDLYMGVVFLARQGDVFGEGRCFDDAARQVVNFHSYLFNVAKGLMHHCWYSDVQRPGVAYWGRANGWALLAQVELLDRLPDRHPQRATLLTLLQQHIQGITRYQSDEGMWHQLLDKQDSYLETSCTAMFTYAIARAVNKGYIDRRFSVFARRGWKGVESRIRPDGQIEGVCAGTGVGEDLAHYFHRPTPLNDVHGTGAVLLAGAEMICLP